MQLDAHASLKSPSAGRVLRAVSIRLRHSRVPHNPHRCTAAGAACSVQLLLGGHGRGALRCGHGAYLPASIHAAPPPAGPWLPAAARAMDCSDRYCRPCCAGVHDICLCMRSQHRGGQFLGSVSTIALPVALCYRSGGVETTYPSMEPAPA